MSDNLFNKVYNPDVLSCLANLSNDEVFTPPEIVNQMLDMLPQELFRNPDTTFLDPACKTGVFLREIAKRLIKGLEPQIPDLQERIDHIFHKQLFGIAITELTSLLSRRGIYCSKYPNSDFSVTKFDTAQGNIRFKRIDHTWVNGRCKYCGTNKTYDRGEELETHAYEFIHTDNLEKLFNMKFDVIISNPPYQMSFGIEGANSSNAKSIYNLFINKAVMLNPKYLVMITPSRWMTKTSQGIPEEWVDSLLQSNHFKEIHDFEDSADCFPGVSIMGGVNYFLYDSSYNGKCKYSFHYAGGKDVITRIDYLDSNKAGIVIRDPKSYSILEKIKNIDGEYYINSDNNFSGLVSPKHFFDNSELLTSNWRGYKKEKDNLYSIKYYVSKSFNDIPFGWIKLSDLPKNQRTKDLHKVYIPAANGSSDIVLGVPFYGEPNSVCSQTYLVIGYDPDKHNFTKQECENIVTYIKTRFFRYLVSIKKKTQNGPRGVYQFVPLQDFSKPWTDEELYAKYGLTQEEIDFIESMLRPME
ncbi:MAG: Eco57I restriction-modification methylase domain-containing protein [Clostridia bacterium]|nr:Eco57I restriction-modification methylase domain-containing protein [Clostridia bacterium]